MSLSLSLSLLATKINSALYKSSLEYFPVTQEREEPWQRKPDCLWAGIKWTWKNANPSTMMPTRIKPFARKEPNLNRKIVKNHCQNNESIQINHPLIESDYFHKSLHPFYPFYSYISQMLRQIYDMASYAHRAIKAVYWACGDFWWLDQSEIHLGLKYKTQVFCSISSAAKLKLPDDNFLLVKHFKTLRRFQHHHPQPTSAAPPPRHRPLHL